MGEPYVYEIIVVKRPEGWPHNPDGWDDYPDLSRFEPRRRWFTEAAATKRAAFLTRWGYEVEIKTYRLVEEAATP